MTNATDFFVAGLEASQAILGLVSRVWHSRWQVLEGGVSNLHAECCYIVRP
jgi:hypothetical protein